MFSRSLEPEERSKAPLSLSVSWLWAGVGPRLVLAGGPSEPGGPKEPGGPREPGGPTEPGGPKEPGGPIPPRLLEGPTSFHDTAGEVGRTFEPREPPWEEVGRLKLKKTRSVSSVSRLLHNHLEN